MGDKLGGKSKTRLGRRTQHPRPETSWETRPETRERRDQGGGRSTPALPLGQNRCLAQMPKGKGGNLNCLQTNRRGLCHPITGSKLYFYVFPTKGLSELTGSFGYSGGLCYYSLSLLTDSEIAHLKFGWFEHHSCLRWDWVILMNEKFAQWCKPITSGQIIATSHDLTPNGGLVREIHLFQGNLGWWNIIIWPDHMLRTKAFFQVASGQWSGTTGVKY